MIDKYINKVIQGDCLEVIKELPTESIDMCITSPPYWSLRDYGITGQLGLEATFKEYINKLCDIFDEAKRVLVPQGTCWVNLGDTYMGNSSYNEKGRQGFGNDKKCNMRKLIKSTDRKTTKTALKCFGSNGLSNKCLCQIPNRFAIQMTESRYRCESCYWSGSIEQTKQAVDYYCPICGFQARKEKGWILRNEIIWHKKNCMPASVTDRFTVDFEKLFFFSKNTKYYFKQQKEPTVQKDNRVRDRDNTKLNNTPGRTRMAGLKTNNYEYKNKRTVWAINPKPYKEAHFAVYPEKLCQTPILAGCPKNGIVLDPFSGAGTTALVALKLGRRFIGIELNPDYIEITQQRIKQEQNQLKLF